MHNIYECREQKIKEHESEISILKNEIYIITMFFDLTSIYSDEILKDNKFKFLFNVVDNREITNYSFVVIDKCDGTIVISGDFTSNNIRESTVKRDFNINRDKIFIFAKHFELKYNISPEKFFDWIQRFHFTNNFNFDGFDFSSTDNEIISEICSNQI
jgi:hypothetical protein